MVNNIWVYAKKKEKEKTDEINLIFYLRNEKKNSIESVRFLAFFSIKFVKTRLEDLLKHNHIPVEFFYNFFPQIILFYYL